MVSLIFLPRSVFPLAAISALLLSGCSGDARDEPPSTTAARPITAPAGAPAPTRPEGAVTGSKIVPGKDSAGMRLDVYGLHREGKLMRLDWTITNLGDERLFAADFFSLGPGTIAAVDTKGLKRYVLVRDSVSKSELFTRPSVYLTAGATLTGAGYFAAAPQDVTEMEVTFDAYGTYKVPVS